MCCVALSSATINHNVMTLLVPEGLIIRTDFKYGGLRAV